MSVSTGIGTTLGWLSTLPATYTLIAEVRNVGGPGFTRDSVERTHLGSTGGYREFFPGLRDGGEIEFELNLDFEQASHSPSTGLFSTYEDDTIHTFQLTFPDGTICEFDGFITDFEFDIPLDDLITSSVTLKITGAPTWTVAP
jgi:predicted secreted protein